MIKIYPYLYRACAASCGAISTLPIDIIQTSILTQKNISLKVNELPLILLMSNLFAIQNTVFTSTTCIPNISIRAIIASLSISPFVILIQAKKYYYRFGISPIYKNFIFWTTLREIVFYISIYNLYKSNFFLSQFFIPILSNIFAYTFKILAIKKSYHNLYITNKNILYSAILEIFKSSLGDSIALFLIYNYEFSPFNSIL